jgi:hypothetical protein
MKTPLQPYSEIRPVADQLWVLDGEWYQTRFRRRMTIIRLRSGHLLIHNAIRLEEEDYKKIDELGKVEYIIAPNSLHGSEAHFYKERYPKAKLFVSTALEGKFRKLCQIDGVLPGAFGQNLRDEVDCVEFQGTRSLHENVLFHISTKTLIVTDLVFNLDCEVSGFEKFFFKWNKIDKRFGPSRIFKYFIVGDTGRVAQSLDHILHWNFDRVIMNHGNILDKGGRAALRKGFEEIGIRGKT